MSLQKETLPSGESNFILIGIGTEKLFTVLFKWLVVFSELGLIDGEGVFGEENLCLVTGEVQAFIGVGSIPAPD